MKSYRVTGVFKTDIGTVMDVFLDAESKDSAVDAAEALLPGRVRSWNPHELTEEEILNEFEAKRGDVPSNMKAVARRLKGVAP